MGIKPQWTNSQKCAIETIGRDVLVSASAGTGKTAVLAQRCAQRVLDPKAPTDVDRILVLTYTDAAAEEMRHRIEQTLRKQAAVVNTAPLRRQLLLLDGAWISTFHSFCRRVIAEYFYLLDLNPQFAIVDPDQKQLLQARALTAMLEEAWANPELSAAMEELFAGRNVQPFGPGSFVNQLIDLQEFLESVPERETFAARAGRPEALEAIRQAQAQRAEAMLRTCLEKIEYTQIMDRRVTGGEWLTAFLQEEYVPFIETCLKLIERGQWDVLYDLIQSQTFKRFPNKPKEVEKDIAELIKAPVKDVKDDIKGLCDLAFLNPQYDALVAGAAQVQTLLELVQRFERHYRSAKEEMGALDFADLEHYMLRLLTEHSEVGRTLRQRFEYVFVDEFQDINAVQKRILDAVRRADNLFVVGDVKQSIYAFRRSRPRIFLDALGQSSDDMRGGGPLRVDLGENFRSAAAILDFANTVFGRIMSRDTASMDYDDKAMLKSGLKAEKPADGPAVELCILEEDSGEADSADGGSDNEDSGPTETLSAQQKQAAYIARRIREMVGADTGKAQLQIYDKSLGAMRDVTYRDIVVLMRSVARRGQEYTEVLQLAGVPVSSQSSSGYFETTEVTDCLCLLKVLDNPIRDIELAAVLRSVFFGFDDTLLAEIRLFAEEQGKKNISFYEALRLYAEKEPESTGKAKAADALATLSRWRDAVRTGSLSQVFGRLLDETGYVAFVSALPNGRQRRANLMKLHDRAIQFEHFSTGPQSTSLARFVEFLEKLMDRQQDWSPAQPDSAAENAVRICSVHRSKGLEFPVVFMAELNTRFNTRDLAGACLADEDAVGLRVVDRERRVQFATMAHQVLADRKRQTLLEEEMRILYVALTRARERLILTACCEEKKAKAILDPAALAGDAKPPAWKLLEAKCAFDWILHGLSDQAELMAQYGHEAGKTGDCPCFCVRRIGGEDLAGLTTYVERIKQQRKKTALCKPGDEAKKRAKELAGSLKGVLNWEYPYKSSTELEAKFSVSELVSQKETFEGDFLRVPGAVAEEEGKSVEASQIGTAYHLVLSRIDLAKDINESAIQDLIESLIKEEQLLPTAAQMIQPEQIIAFFNSEMGVLVRGNSDEIMREWPFTIGLPASELIEAAGEDIVILQGIVDMIIPTPEGLIVVDFKTDHVSKSGLTERISRYTPQLEYYCRAANAILDKPIRKACLFFLSAGELCEVSL